jgi:hypothetical protein
MCRCRDEAAERGKHMVESRRTTDGRTEDYRLGDQQVRQRQKRTGSKMDF